MRRIRSVCLLLLCVLCWTGPSFGDERGLEFFEAKIRPVLVERCGRCHSDGEKAPKGGLGLDSPAGLSKEADSGVVIAPGKVDESQLIDAIAHIRGATDEFGFKAVEGRFGVHERHATILHLLGLDHEKLTCRYSGRDRYSGRHFRLTEVSGEVVQEILT